ncbi:hypothetical protein AKJ41_06435 [candidate division MSBL1 archaeon SCGC-AAA259O05]|uniref:Uncharacterized protein n=1 Tax=candidate division MSBL1 archaeon SCGC-AAA259O05 TaxID=1698271 RepID=A0A133UWT0_9EURY|nr:hypothetical protein AKJ41_06435 [candidate division MSBL1 archaeon SCGC-AAA259O05]
MPPVYACPRCGKFMRHLKNPSGKMLVALECPKCGETALVGSLKPVQDHEPFTIDSTQNNGELHHLWTTVRREDERPYSDPKRAKKLLSNPESVLAKRSTIPPIPT